MQFSTSGRLCFKIKKNVKSLEMEVMFPAGERKMGGQEGAGGEGPEGAKEQWREGGKGKEGQGRRGRCPHRSLAVYPLRPKDGSKEQVLPPHPAELRAPPEASPLRSPRYPGLLSLFSVVKQELSQEQCVTVLG